LNIGNSSLGSFLFSKPCSLLDSMVARLVPWRIFLLTALGATICRIDWLLYGRHQPQLCTRRTRGLILSLLEPGRLSQGLCP
jgi:hypothetical protein